MSDKRLTFGTGKAEALTIWGTGLAPIFFLDLKLSYLLLYMPPAVMMNQRGASLTETSISV